MLQLMKTFLKRCDTSGYTPEMNFNRKKKYKTVIGGILSILLLILTTLATIAFGEDLIKRQQPIIVTKNEFGDPKLNITADTLVGFRAFLDGGKRIENITRYINPIIIHSQFLEKIETAQVDKYTMIQCKDSHLYQNNVMNVTSIITNPEIYYCLPNGLNLLLKGKFNLMHICI